MSTGGKTPTSEAIQQVTQQLIDQGKLIEAGWMSYRLLVMPQSAGPVQVDETRKAFFAGAQHLFGSIMSALEPDAEPTENDLRRMDQINAELHCFYEELKAAVAARGT